jgi:pyrimidine operon attenuation protein/uracil phosphoribosyltransferase
MAEKLILSSQDIEKIIETSSNSIFSDIAKADNFAIIGVQTRGVELALRIKKIIEKLSGREIPFGILDITFFRDDIGTRKNLPIIKETRIDFDISGMNILLVDDVIFTGRTTKAALETLTSFGRPSRIKLFNLVDRGNRELPIQPDYAGFKISTSSNEDIRVTLKDIDEADSVYHIIPG